jgi:nucleoside-diphosphate-sugar epimerase
MIHATSVVLLLLLFTTSTTFQNAVVQAFTTSTNIQPHRHQQRPLSTSQDAVHQQLKLRHSRQQSQHPHSLMSLQATPYQKIFVAGGSKGVGRCIVEQLIAQQRQVVTLIRNPEDCDLDTASPYITIIKGDAFVIKDVERAMDGCDAAITTLGGSSSTTDTTSTTNTNTRVDYVGNNHVIESAGILGITRVLLVTSVGCGTSKAAAPATVFESLKEVLLAKERAENVLIKYYTNMNWTIVRPGGLKSAPATGTAILTEDVTTAIGTIHREDVAALVVQALDAPSTERKIFSAIDPTIESSMTVDMKQVTAFAL